MLLVKCPSCVYFLFQLRPPSGPQCRQPGDTPVPVQQLVYFIMAVLTVAVLTLAICSFIQQMITAHLLCAGPWGTATHKTDPAHPHRHSHCQSLQGSVSDSRSPALLPFCSPAPVTCPQIPLQSLAATGNPEHRGGSRRGSGCLSRGLPPAPAHSVPSLFMTNNDGYSCQTLRLPGQTGGGAASLTFLNPRQGGSSPCPRFPLPLLIPSFVKY